MIGGKKLTDILIGIVVFFMAVIVISIFLLANADLTAREAGLLGIFLTLLSVIVGGAITHLYSASSYKTAIEEVGDFHQKNLRTYALKAAEKVNNLSKELSRLAAYIEEEIELGEHNSVAEELHILEERIYGVTHIINTLKSVNDTSLSDWQGVIGDELNERREEEEQREELLRELVERFEQLEGKSAFDKQFGTEMIRADLDAMKKELRMLISQNVPHYMPRHIRNPPNQIHAKCPVCGNSISYKQKAKSKKKSLRCNTCASELISERTENGEFILRMRKSLSESVQCPSCKDMFSLELDELVGVNDIIRCGNCEQDIRVTRASDGLRIHQIEKPKVKMAITEEIIQKVREQLPTQPWPKHVDKTVADKLGLPHQIVQKAIQQLVSRGVFQDQIDGQICTTAEKLRIIRETGSHL